MARAPSDPNGPASWVQTNTEFHQDWAAQENQGHHIHWKSGLSLESTPSPQVKRHPVQVAPRKGQRWLVWLVTVGLLIGVGLAFAEGLRIADVMDALRAIRHAL